MAYGTDPFNPSGPINPYQRWPYVAPRSNPNEDIGTPWDGTGYLAPGELRAETRYEYPDWWLFKRGDTFNLYQDYLSYARETNPSVSEEDFGAGSLAVSGGRSVTERQIVGAYGDLAHARPRFINPSNWAFIARWADPDPKHIAYLSLHFDGRGVRRGKGFNFRTQGSDAVDILLEDCWIDGTSGNSIQNTSANITLRRCVVTDAWNDTGEHLQGLFFYGMRDARLRLEECIFMRNGFSHGDPMITGWPPSGTQYFDVYNRNLYLSGECDSMESGVFDTISMIGASGDQFRPGMRMERNFFFQGYVQMGAHGGYPDADGPTGTIVDNILLRFKGSGTNDNRGHPGWGFGLSSGAYQVEVARNIVTGAQYNEDDYGISLEALGWYCYSHTFHYQTRYNTIHDNIFDTASAVGAIRIVDGIDPTASLCDVNPPNWSDPGVFNNTVSNNILINDNNQEAEYRSEVSDDGVDDTNTTFSGNTIYLSRAEAAADQGWSDPDRTLKTYLESLGHTVDADSDGFLEFFNLARLQRKGYWNEDLTSRALVNYFRNGFGMTELP